MFDTQQPPIARRRLLGALALAAAALVAACGGGGGDDVATVEDEFTFIDTAGRLALADHDQAMVHLHDLDSGALAGSFPVAGPAATLYASPGGRYAVALQRPQDRVQFVDGGIWQEDHGEHLHDYKEAGRLMPFSITGPQPTHYDVQHGRQAAVFMDGRANVMPVQNASVQLFTDASVAAGRLEASLDLPIAIHGLAEPLDDTLLAAHRADDAGDTLPTHLQRFDRSGAGYVAGPLVQTRCDGMHGSYTSGRITAAGCLDGLLVVKHTATGLEDTRVATASRVGTVAGHPKLPGHFIGISNVGTGATATTRFYAVDGAAGTSVEMAPTGWTPAQVRRAHGFDRSGQKFFILDNLGTLHVMQRQDNAWVTAAQLPTVIASPAAGTGVPLTSFAANGARDEIYLSDPVTQQIVVVDSSALTVQQRIPVGMKVSSMTWLGIAR